MYLLLLVLALTIRMVIRVSELERETGRVELNFIGLQTEWVEINQKQ